MALFIAVWRVLNKLRSKLKGKKYKQEIRPLKSYETESKIRADLRYPSSCFKQFEHYVGERWIVPVSGLKSTASLQTPLFSNQK